MTSWALALAVLALDVLAGMLFLARRVARGALERRRRRARKLLAALAAGQQRLPRHDERFVARRRWVFLEECARTSDAVELDAEQRRRISDLLEHLRVHVGLIRDLHSRSRYRRSRAAAYLPLVPVATARVSLIHALESERSRAVKLALSRALCECREAAAIPTIIDTLAGEPLRYQRSLWGLLAGFGESMIELAPLLSGRAEREIQLLLMHVAAQVPSAALRDYLVTRVDSPDLDIAREAFRLLAAAYPTSLDHARYLAHEDFLIRNLAAESLGSVPTSQSLGLLFEHLDDPLARRSTALALTAVVRARPQHFRTLMFRCLNEQRPLARAILAEVLAGFADYLMGSLVSPEGSTAARLLAEILRQGKSAEIANFLNRNTNTGIERRALALIRPLAAEEPRVAAALQGSLDPRLLEALGLVPLPPPASPPPRRARPRLSLLYTFLALGAGLVPVVSLALAVMTRGDPGSSVLARFLARFDAAFAIYAACLNGSYLVLLAVSWAGVRRQARLASLQRLSFLFRESVLPSISIITPAYNEEASIVESVSSLLTLRYPDYEVIVVNDGSKDRTLERLVSWFALERTDVFIHRYLATREVRGVWASRRYPGLLVIDKENGGKADALNAGINVARKEYFAAIDSDSMLERDALLSLAAMSLTEEDEVVAAGGNILPVNGCIVRSGSLVDVRIPRRALPRFQTVEYLRAFMAGRVGWATLRALLIISGAFGIFDRRRVIDAHGYLTRSEHYLEDTVGEDMELVVRLHRRLREAKTSAAILYCFRANCWTEIPERMKVLSRQRDRWQRGLLEILTFHFRMMFNPRYGRPGVIAFPYFLVFEALGPWFEAEGYLALAASFALGAITTPLALLVFTATIALGLLVSISSLLLAEHDRELFRPGDRARLLAYAFLENFGFRQLMSLLRIRGFVRMLAGVRGWGQMERRGLGQGGPTT